MKQITIGEFSAFMTEVYFYIKNKAMKDERTFSAQEFYSLPILRGGKKIGTVHDMFVDYDRLVGLYRPTFKDKQMEFKEELLFGGGFLFREDCSIEII